jgi:hypothetical protein
MKMTVRPTSLPLCDQSDLVVGRECNGHANQAQNDKRKHVVNSKRSRPNRMGPDHHAGEHGNSECDQHSVVRVHCRHRPQLSVHSERENEKFISSAS